MVTTTRAGLAAAALSAALLASSCGWLAGDVFPAWVPFVDGRADLAAAAEAAGIGTIRYVPTIEYSAMEDAAGADASKVLVYIEGLDGEALAAFEPDGLGAAKTWKRSADSADALSYLGPRVVTTPDGFVAGNLAFGAADLDAEPTIVAAAMPGGLILAFGDPVSYYVPSSYYDETLDRHFFYITQYADIAAMTLVTSADRVLEISGAGARLIDAGFFPASDSGADTLRILVETGDGAYAVSFDYSASTILAAADPALTGPLPINDGGGWLTADGVVTLFHDEGTTLARYAYGAVGTADAPPAPADELVFGGDTEDFSVASFDAAGDRWYLHDGLRDLLYAMRTWW